MNTLKAETRNMSLKAKALRKEGFVTGCIFGRELEKSIPLKMEKSEVERLQLEGKTYDALIKEVDYNPLKGFVEEIDFQALVSSEKVHSSAEIHLLNESKLVAGIPQQMLHEINYKALPASLVEKIELDVGDLKIGDTIRVKDLVIAKDENIDLITDLDSTVVTVTEPRVSTDVTSETEEAAE